MNTVCLDKCLKAAEMLYGVFPFGVLERLYGGKLDRDETIKAAEGKFDYIDSNLDEFEALGYAPGYFTPAIYEDGEEYEKYKARGDCINRREFAICTDFFRHFAGDFLPPCRDSLPPRQFS